MVYKRFRNSRLLVYPDGRLVSEVTGTDKSQHDNGTGYKAVNVILGDKGKRKSKRMYVHRIVAECFIPNPQNLPEVNHLNGIKEDNRVENLEWCTPRHNILHAMVNGNRKVDINGWLSPKPTPKIRVKKPPIIRRKRETVYLKPELVPEVRAKLFSEQFTYNELAFEYGVSVAQINYICHGRKPYDIYGEPPIIKINEGIERRKAEKRAKSEAEKARQEIRMKIMEEAEAVAKRNPCIFDGSDVVFVDDIPCSGWFEMEDVKQITTIL